MEFKGKTLKIDVAIVCLFVSVANGIKFAYFVIVRACLHHHCSNRLIVGMSSTRDAVAAADRRRTRHFAVRVADCAIIAVVVVRLIGQQIAAVLRAAAVRCDRERRFAVLTAHLNLITTDRRRRLKLSFRSVK